MGCPDRCHYVGIIGYLVPSSPKLIFQVLPGPASVTGGTKGQKRLHFPIPVPCHGHRKTRRTAWVTSRRGRGCYKVVMLPNAQFVLCHNRLNLHNIRRGGPQTRPEFAIKSTSSRTPALHGFRLHYDPHGQRPYPPSLRATAATYTFPAPAPFNNSAHA